MTDNTMPLLEDQSCENCKFFMQLVVAHPEKSSETWDGGDDGLYHIGSCRAHAPTVNPARDINGFFGMGRWPRTYAYEWCGSWSAMVNAAIEPDDSLIEGK